jgi:hypothetical protein
MKEILLTTAYLPPVDYFTLLVQHDIVLIEAFENYQKQSYRNRCRISGPNGVNVLSVPVDKQGKQKVLMKDLRISYHQPWPKLHWRTITTAYNNSPFFMFYRDELEPFYHKRYDFLLDFNFELLQLVLKWLRCDRELRYSTFFESVGTQIMDYRYLLHPKKEITHPCKPYHQVFFDTFGFIQGLSIIDLIFNEGPGSVDFIK